MSPEDLANIGPREKYKSLSGATSSTKAHRYDLIPKEALDCLADRYELGLKTHQKDNWKIGQDDNDFILNRLNCMQEHMLDLVNGNFQEDDEWGHLGAIMWGCAFRAYLIKRKENENRAKT